MKRCSYVLDKQHVTIHPQLVDEFERANLKQAVAEIPDIGK